MHRHGCGDGFRELRLDFERERVAIAGVRPNMCFVAGADKMRDEAHPRLVQGVRI